MLSDVLLPLPRFFESLSSFQLLMAGAVLLGVAAFLLAYAHGRRVALQRTVVTEDWALQLTRIANALERIAAWPADGLIAETPRRHSVPIEDAAPPPEVKEHSILNSMFGR